MMSLACIFLAGVSGFAQTTVHKRSVTKAPMAVWTPEVQQTLGISASDFTADGLNKLTKAQLDALVSSAKPDPKKHFISCPASGTVPAGRVRVLVTVAGDDPSGQIAGMIHR